jgi:hypothetical protein
MEESGVKKGNLLNAKRVRIDEITRTSSIDTDGNHELYDRKHKVSKTEPPLVRVIKIQDNGTPFLTIDGKTVIEYYYEGEDEDGNKRLLRLWTDADEEIEAMGEAKTTKIQLDEAQDKIVRENTQANTGYIKRGMIGNNVLIDVIENKDSQTITLTLFPINETTYRAYSALMRRTPTNTTEEEDLKSRLEKLIKENSTSYVIHAVKDPNVFQKLTVLKENAMEILRRIGNYFKPSRGGQKQKYTKRRTSTKKRTSTKRRISTKKRTSTKRRTSTKKRTSTKRRISTKRRTSTKRGTYIKNKHI